MKRALSILAALALAFAAPASAQTEISGAARHVAIMDGESGVLLYCDECEVPMPPASMSKLMTVLLVAEKVRAGELSLDTRFPVSENAWRHGAVSDGSHMFLELGSEVSVRDLLAGVIVVSANDACIVLAEGIAGSEEAFVVQMNRRAQELGLRSARFRNVTGLPDPEHVISSADLARLARYLMRADPDLYERYAQPEFTYNNHTQQNRNPLLGAFAGADGVKTGHTSISGYGLVGSALLDGRRRVIVFNGTRSMAERRSEALRLMRAAFHDFAATRLAEADSPIGEAELYMGSRATVPLMAQTDIVIGGARAVQTGLSAHIVYQGPIPAPVRQGDQIAELVVEGPGFETQRFPLVAAENVGRANWFSRAWRGLQVSFGAQ